MMPDRVCAVDGCNRVATVSEYLLNDGPSTATWRCVEHMIDAMVDIVVLP